MAERECVHDRIAAVSSELSGTVGVAARNLASPANVPWPRSNTRLEPSWRRRYEAPISPAPERRPVNTAEIARRDGASPHPGGHFG